jgi:hypothetical protein
MEDLTEADVAHFARILAERKVRLGDEIRRVLARTQNEKRLEAYPTAKRCIEDQQRRERLRAGPSHPRS